MARDTLDLLNHLGDDWQQVHVVGISMGMQDLLIPPK